jgi:aldehyde dehydrogenase family 7 protein A1
MYIYLQIHDEVVQRLVKGYEQIMKRVGDPIDPSTIYGPMHSQVGVNNYLNTVKEAEALGGKVAFGGKVRPGRDCDILLKT